jgi:hypothetical protein
MLDLLLTMLFTAAGIGAVWAMAFTWRSHAPAVRQLRDELAHCDSHRTLRTKVMTVRVLTPYPGVTAIRTKVRSRLAASVPALPLAA